MKNLPRQNVFLWLFVGLVFVGFALYSLAYTDSGDTTSSTAADATNSTEPAPTPTEETFHGIACAPDCSDAEQGYYDAQADNPKNRDACSNNERSDQYNQGCSAYFDDQAQAAASNDSDQSNQSDQSTQSDQPAQSDQSGQSDQSDSGDQSNQGP